jgi:hypothetical protein
MENNELIELIQKWVARGSVGSSTVRGQPKGTIDKSIEYLQSVDLQSFSEAENEEEFKVLLDKATNKLEDVLPSKSWGMARKVLNIFLLHATQNITLNKKFGLDRIIPYLELPLDNPNAKRLIKLAKPEGKRLVWKKISSLKPEENLGFQEYAKLYAKKRGIERCYLDACWWRSEE